MRELVEIAREKFFVRTMTAQELRDYAKAAAAALTVVDALGTADFFDTPLARHEDALVQQLSAELVARGIPEQVFLQCLDSAEKLNEALEKTENLDDPQRLVKAWCQVNHHFLSRATARKENVVFPRLMSKWQKIERQAQEAGNELPVQ